MPAIPAHDIAIDFLDLSNVRGSQHTSTAILNNCIDGISIEHIATTQDVELDDAHDTNLRTIYLFLKGTGKISVHDSDYAITPETIFLPNTVSAVAIKPKRGETLHYLKVSCTLTRQDLLELKQLPAKNTRDIYLTKFTDCQTYTESIKSETTVSRTILSNKFIPRIAMGTVQTMGPDMVEAHEHPMLQQLFLGLSGNECVVYADDSDIRFPQHSILHIPLGSKHSVAVADQQTMYYVWMDFFLDKQGELWLDTHHSEN